MLSTNVLISAGWAIKIETFARMKDSKAFFVKSHMTIKENMEIGQ